MPSFQGDLPSGLTPKKSFYHEIQIEIDSKPLHRPLLQLSPSEVEASKEYVEKLLKTGKIRPRKSPYGASLFCVKNSEGHIREVKRISVAVT